MQTIWLSPTNYVTGDPSLLISYPYVSHPGTIVTCKTGGDFKWVSMSLGLPKRATIQQVIVCYQLSNSRSSILQVRLSQMSTPDHALVIHDDPTNLQSTTPACYTSVIGGITVDSDAAVMLELRLNFQNKADQILLGAVGIVLNDALLPADITDQYNVLSYGADQNGVKDSAPAFRQAMHDANAASFSGSNGPVGFFSMPEVFVPAGRYKIGSDLGVSGALLIRGHNAILYDPTDTINFLTLPYTHLVEGITFEGGNSAITIANNNVGETVWIRDCQFYNQVAYAVGSDASSGSTQIVMESSLFLDDVTTGTTCHFQSGDDIFMSLCNVVSSREYVFTLVGCNFTVRDCLAAPNNPLGAWALCNGGQFKAYRFRFGGESGGKCFVEWHSLPGLVVSAGSAYVPTALVLEDCETYSTTFAIKFYSLPGFVRCRGNAGDNARLYFDPAIPLNERQTMQRLFYADFRGNFADWTPDLTSDQMVATMMTAVPRGEDFEHGDYVTPADRALFIPALAAHGDYGTGWGENGQPTNLAGGTTTDLFGETIPYYACANPAAIANYGLTYYTGLNGLSPGPYTAVYAVEVLNGHANMSVDAAGMVRGFYLRQGRHVLSLHFWHSYSNLLTPAWRPTHPYAIGDIVVVSNAYGPTAAWRCVTPGMSGTTAGPFVNGFVTAQVTDGTAVWEWVQDLSISYDIQMFGNAQINVSAIRVFSGHVTVRDWRTTAYGSAIPTTGFWQVGDKIINTVPTAGGVEGWICTVAGGANSGAWTGANRYSVGTCVTNGGGIVYQCMQTGTSAAAGGPTGSAGNLNIVDGTCVWNAIANTLAVFKTMGVIGP